MFYDQLTSGSLVAVERRREESAVEGAEVGSRSGGARARTPLDSRIGREDYAMWWRYLRAQELEAFRSSRLVEASDAALGDK